MMARMPDIELVESPDERNHQPRPGIGLCLSGGGYRAMVFHIGVMWRLYETGILKTIGRISSVSGGSITSAVLGMVWNRLSFDPSKLDTDFLPLFVAPLRAQAARSIDAKAVVLGGLLPGTISERVERAYEEHLYGNATLQDLPDSPRFVINATNVQSGALWRFSKPYMRDYRVGSVERPRVSLAKAVTASSAFPPVLSPCVLELKPGDFTPGSGLDLQRPPYTAEAMLSDGGVYDNLGLETVWKRFETVFVSDGGGKMQAQAEPEDDWVQHSIRVADIVDNQVRSLRKRLLIDSYRAAAGAENHRKGCYWGIRSDVKDYPAPDALSCPVERTVELANLKTRLSAMESETQERLINWGYAICDQALRSHYDKSPGAPRFPYAGVGV